MCNSNFPVLVLAGGLGTRLGKYSENIPKYMVEISGYPFAYWQIQLLKKQGIKDIIILVSHHAETIVDYLGDGEKFGINIKYSYDGKTQLGTGGAIRKAVKDFKIKQFILVYGDSYLPVDIKPILKEYKNKNKPSLMCVYKNKGLLDTPNVLLRNGVLEKYSKKQNNFDMQHIDYGLSIFKGELFDFHMPNCFDLDVLTEMLVKKGLMSHFEVKKRFYEIGSISGLIEFRKLVKGGYINELY